MYYASMRYIISRWDSHLGLQGSIWSQKKDCKIQSQNKIVKSFHKLWNLKGMTVKDFNKIYNFKVQLSKDSEQNQHRHQQNIYDL